MWSFILGFLTCYILAGILISVAVLSDPDTPEEKATTSSVGLFIMRTIAYIVVALIWPFAFGWGIANKGTTTYPPTVEVAPVASKSND